MSKEQSEDWTKIKTLDLMKLINDLKEAQDIATHEHNELLCLQKKMEKVMEWADDEIFRDISDYELATDYGNRKKQFIKDQNKIKAIITNQNENYQHQ